MSTQFAVDLVFKSQTQQLDQVASKIQQLERDLGKLKGSDPFEDVEKSARDAGREVDEMGNKAKKASGAFSGLGAVIGRLALAYAGMQAVKFVFGKTAELESQTASLKVLTGEIGKAKQIIGELQQFANITPFTSADLIDTAKRLKAFGVDTEKLVDTTKRLGDVAGATGADLSGVATAYGQIMAKGRLQGEELLQLQERGICLQGELQKMYGMTGDEFRDALEKGRISAKAVELALQRLTDAGGKYANGAIAQSDTLAGKLSTLQDAFETLAKNIGKFFEPVFKWMIDSVTSIINRLNDSTLMADEVNASQGAGQRARAKFGIRALNPFDSEVNKYRDKTEKDLLKVNRSGRAAANAGGGIKPAPSVTAAGPNAVPELLAGNSAKKGSGAEKPKEPKLPAYIDKEVLRKWLYSQGMGRTSGDFTNAGHRTPNHMLNAMDMGFTSSKYDHNYVQKTIEMERKLRATGAFGNQLFGPERDPKGHKDHMHVPTPGGKVKMTAGLGSLMGMAGSGPEGQYELAQQLMSTEQERLMNMEKMRVGAAELLLNSQAQVALSEQLNPIEKERLLTAEAKRKIEAEYAQKSAELAQLGGDAAIAATLEQAKKNELLAQDLELTNRIAEIKESAMSGLKEENAQMEAKLAGKEQEYLIEQKIASLKKQGVDPVEATALVQRNEQLKQQVAILDQTKAQWSSLAQTVESEIGSAMSNAITGLIEGTTTAQQAFSQMFKNIGKAFIDMATQMIAKALVMKALGVLTGGGGGGLGGILSGGGGAGFSQAFAGSGGMGSSGFGMSLFAEGGFVTGPTRALIGEAGDSEYVIPSQKMGDAMANYSAGKRGSLVLNSSGSSSSSGGDGGGGAFTLETVVINSIEYATVEQVRAMGQAAAKQGAAGGHARVMGDFRNKRSVRSRLGV